VICTDLIRIEDECGVVLLNGPSWDLICQFLEN
jgi:hypothetical protein